MVTSAFISGASAVISGASAVISGLSGYNMLQLLNHLAKKS